MNRTGILILIGALVFAGTDAASRAGSNPAPRGGCVGWARIITSNTTWKRHADVDPRLMEFIRRQPSLNLDPTWYSADPVRLWRYS